MSGVTLDPAAAQVIVNEDNPWPGLLPFGEKDQAFFKGRTSETQDLLRLVLRERLAVLFGVSGLGKSSLLQAGLFPLLRGHDILPVNIRLNFSGDRPDLISQVWNAVLGEAAQSGIEPPERRGSETLWETFHRQDADFWNQRNRPVMPLLTFDQFEEIFTLGRADAERIKATAGFINQLADLAEGRPPPSVEALVNERPEEAENFTFERHYYKILLAVREDFLPDLEGLRPRMSAIALNRIRLRRMNGDAALLAVNQAPHLIDDGAAKVVVRFVAAAKEPDAQLKSLEVEPALLSVVCSELNLKRKARGEPKITTGLLEGSQDAILSDFYERSFAGLPAEVRDYVEEHLLTKKGFRDSVALENAVNAPGVSREAIDLLVKRRLIRIEDRGGERVELIHDLLTGVVRASRDIRRGQREHLEARKREETARKEAEERERQRRVLQDARRNRRLVLGFLLLTMVATVMAALYAYRQGQEAERRRTEAVIDSIEADRRRREADIGRREAELQAAAASRAAIQERVARAAAQAERDKATKAANEATTQRGIADVERTKAEQKTREAQDAERKSEENAQLALVREGEAKSQKKLADEARLAETVQRKQVTKNLAQSHVLEAGRRVAIERNAEALAYVARAIDEDRDSLAAASFAFDLLLRGGLRSGLEPLPARGQALIHNPITQPERVLSARFSPDGARIVTASWDGVVRVLDWTNQGNGLQLRGHKGLVNSAAFSPNPGVRLIVTASQDTTARIWDAATGRPLHELSHKRPVTSASFSARGDRVVTTSWDNTAVVWDPSTGKPLFPPLTHPLPVTSAAFSADGERLVTSSWDQKARVWLVVSGKLLQELVLQGQVNSAAFSPDGRRVVTASNDTTAQVWELPVRAGESSRPIGAPLRHSAAVNEAAFSPDGRRVVTASDDKTARLWEAETGTPISVPLRHEARVSSAAFSPDGLRVVTASYDKTVRVWEVRFATDDSALLGKLAEAVSGHQVKQLPDLVPLPDKEKVLAGLRDRARQPSASEGSTMSFIRWFFTQSK